MSPVWTWSVGQGDGHQIWSCSIELGRDANLKDHLFFGGQPTGTAKDFPGSWCFPKERVEPTQGPWVDVHLLLQAWW